MGSYTVETVQKAFVVQNVLADNVSVITVKHKGVSHFSTKTEDAMCKVAVLVI